MDTTKKEKIIEELTQDIKEFSVECEENETNDVNNSNNIEDKESNKSGDINDLEAFDEDSIRQRDLSLTEAQKEVYLNIAKDLKEAGNSQFKNADYLSSALSYTEALKICPLVYVNERSIFYSNRAAAKQKMGKKEPAIEDCTKAIEFNGNYVRAYLRRAALYEETDKLDEALEDYKKILELDPGNKCATSACLKLPSQINEKNERLKQEMLGKLKDLGNVVLKPFGLSTNNFKMTQDPNSGGYSINFVQNN